MFYLIHIAIFCAIYGILAISLNLVLGYTGLLSVTQAAFYGLGAYATAILSTRFNLGFGESLLIGIAIVSVVSFLVGLVLSKLAGDYYAVATLGFNVIIVAVMLNWSALTNGPLGIAIFSKTTLFGLDFSSQPAFLALALFLLFLAYGIGYYLKKSSFGRVLKAIREDEKAIQVFGYNTTKYKLVIFVIGAALAAAAGSLFAAYISYVDPSSFATNESIFILSVIILGGLANLEGSILGAIFLVLLPELLRFVGFPEAVAAELRQAVYGLLLVILMLYRPQGLLGEYKL